MTGISGVSIESMLANPALIPTLPRGAAVRYLDRNHDLEPTWVDKRVQDLYNNRADIRRSGKLDRAFALIQAIPCRSYISMEKVKCPVFDKICKLADEMEFTPNEKAFIQYHIIGGQRYVCIGESHSNPKFARLKHELIGLAVKRELALFHETICSDPRSETDYFNVCLGVFSEGEFANAPQPPWVFGLEGAGKPLEKASVYYMCTANAVPGSSQAKEDVVVISSKGGKNLVTINPENYSHLNGQHRDFFVEGFFNTPWEQVFYKMYNPTIRAKALTTDADLLCQDLIEAWGNEDEELTLSERIEKLFFPFCEKYKRETWADFYKGVAQFCLTQPQIAGLFSSTEKSVIQGLLKNPHDQQMCDLFIDTIVLQRRNRSFAQALFSADLSKKLPKGTVRVALIGYSHLPGVICELEKLAAAAKKPQENKKA